MWYTLKPLEFFLNLKVVCFNKVARHAVHHLYCPQTLSHNKPSPIMKARLCRLSPLCVMCVNKQPTPSDKKYWYWERTGREMALCLWTCVELNLEERERERCHQSVKRLANKSWQSRGGGRENMEVNESKGDKAEERWGQFFVLFLFHLFFLTPFLHPRSVCLFRACLQFSFF